MKPTNTCATCTHFKIQNLELPRVEKIHCAVGHLSADDTPRTLLAAVNKPGMRETPENRRTRIQATREKLVKENFNFLPPECAEAKSYEIGDNFNFSCWCCSHSQKISVGSTRLITGCQIHAPYERSAEEIKTIRYVGNRVEGYDLQASTCRDFLRPKDAKYGNFVDLIPYVRPEKKKKEIDSALLPVYEEYIEPEVREETHSISGHDIYLVAANTQYRMEHLLVGSTERLHNQIRPEINAREMVQEVNSAIFAIWRRISNLRVFQQIRIRCCDRCYHVVESMKNAVIRNTNNFSPLKVPYQYNTQMVTETYTTFGDSLDENSYIANLYFLAYFSAHFYECRDTWKRAYQKKSEPLEIEYGANDFFDEMDNSSVDYMTRFFVKHYRMKESWMYFIPTIASEIAKEQDTSSRFGAPGFTGRNLSHPYSPSNIALEMLE